MLKAPVSRKALSNQDDGRLDIESNFLPIYGNLPRTRQAYLGQSTIRQMEFENADLFLWLGLPFTLKAPANEDTLLRTQCCS